MSNTLDHLSMLLASKLPRREAIKAAATGFVGSIAVPRLLGSTPGLTSEARKDHIGKKKLRSITLKMQIPGGRTPLVSLPDRFPGTLKLNGEKITLIPSILPNGQTEVAVYRDVEGVPQLATRTMLQVSKQRHSKDAKTTPVDLSFLPGFAVAALWERDTFAAPDYSAEADCSVSCCWGGGLSGAACCCDLADHGCGNCCDPGSCYPNTGMGCSV